MIEQTIGVLITLPDIEENVQEKSDSVKYVCFLSGLAILGRPMAFRPCLATGLALLQKI